MLLVYRKAEERLMGIAGFKKGFENVEEVVLPRDQGQGGMPRGRDEWTGIMKYACSLARAFEMKLTTRAT